MSADSIHADHGRTWLHFDPHDGPRPRQNCMLRCNGWILDKSDVATGVTTDHASLFPDYELLTCHSSADNLEPEVAANVVDEANGKSDEGSG